MNILSIGSGGITVRFTVPKETRKLSGKCPVCDKRVARSRTFEKTVSPFNVNKETREPKTWDEVAADVQAEADAWVPDFTHEACREAE